MSKNKTQPSERPVTEFLAAIEDEARRRDCEALALMMSEVSGAPAVMWGEAMVGFGQYHYRYATGREGTFFRLGFSPRKRELTIYIMPGYTDFGAQLERLGRHKKGKSCLYLRRLSDVDLGVLRELLEAGWRDMAARYPGT